MANLFTSINTICNRRESLGTVVYKLSISAVWFWAGSFITALHSTLSVSAAPESTTRTKADGQLAHVFCAGGKGDNSSYRRVAVFCICKADKAANIATSYRLKVANCTGAEAKVEYQEKHLEMGEFIDSMLTGLRG